MRLEGTVQNGVIVLDPGSPPLADGTRVEVAPRTGMEPLINKTPGVCGGSACIGQRRIAVWSLIESRNVGISDETLLTDFDPRSRVPNWTRPGATPPHTRRKSPKTSAKTTRTDR